MRLWTLHPKYLDARGLVALWREALLAQAVLGRQTGGYTRHPQLIRFRNSPSPTESLASYLQAVHAEASRRGYCSYRGHSWTTRLRVGTPQSETAGPCSVLARRIGTTFSSRDASPVSHRSRPGRGVGGNAIQQGAPANASIAPRRYSSITFTHLTEYVEIPDSLVRDVAGFRCKWRHPGFHLWQPHG